MFAGLVTKSMKVTALRLRSSEMFDGTASPEPPVGQPPCPVGLGRKAVPTGNVAFFVMPDRSPVDATVEASSPAEKSLARSLLTVAHPSRTLERSH